MNYKTSLIDVGLESIATNVEELKALFTAITPPPYDAEFLEAVEISLVGIDANLTQIRRKAEQYDALDKETKE